MENVMMISRHRQWRAWQFGRRHSGLFSGRGGGSTKPDPENDWFLKAPWWKKILALLAMAVVLVVIYETGLLIPLGIIGLVIAFAGK